MSLPKIDYKAHVGMPEHFVSKVWQQSSRALGLTAGGPEICQLFLGSGDRHTQYTLSNLPSMFAPSGNRSCYYDLTLYGEQGEPFATRRVRVPGCTSISVRMEELFGPKLPAIGIVGARVGPTVSKWRRNKHLGSLTPHFYAMYHDDDMDSLALVHPQTALWDIKPEPTIWQSNLVIYPESLTKLEVFQLNPTPKMLESTLTVRLLNGEEVVSSTGNIGPRGVRQIVWQKDDLGMEPIVLSSDNITAPNAKPLVFQHTASGFSAAHS